MLTHNQQQMGDRPSVDDIQKAARALWDDAQIAAAMLATGGGTLGGGHVRCGPGGARDRWLKLLQALAGDAPAWKRLPVSVDTERLIGGLDLALTLSQGRRVHTRGLLDEAQGGFLIAAMAERIDNSVAGLIARAMDETALADKFSLVLLDEGEADEATPVILTERIALTIDLRGIPHSVYKTPPLFNRSDIERAHALAQDIPLPTEMLPALSGACAAAGAPSMRAFLALVAAAKLHAALSRRSAVEAEDAVVASRLVLGLRLASAQDSPPDDHQDAPQDQTNETPDNEESAPDKDQDVQILEDQLIEAVAVAARASDLLQGAQATLNRRKGGAGKAGEAVQSGSRGRMAGERRGDPRRDGRLDVIATLRAAAPWQTLRQREDQRGAARIRVRPDDFRIRRRIANRETVIIFVVDASGSAAMNRMAEAKGAIESLLSDCYARRDQVALIACRGVAAETLLPPSRSLVRARRSLSGLPAGGGTPLASALESALQLALVEEGKGRTPFIVLMTDGRPNIGRDGLPGRPQALDDAIEAAKAIRSAGVSVLFFDTNRRPDARVKALCDTMAGDYRPLPIADAGAISKAVRSVVT
ncbi:MAG: VWA domain-containing protein [Pseudomonadota bacterium]